MPQFVTHFFASCESLNEVFILIKIFYTFTKDFKQGMPFYNQIFHRLSWLLFGEFSYWFSVFMVLREEIYFL